MSPRIICIFNDRYELFLNDVYNYIIIQHGCDLNLSELEVIEMVKSIPGDVDGRMIDEHRIQISARLYDQLPELDIDSLHDNDIFNLIISTLFHELCHISEIAISPSLHKYGFSKNGIKCLIAHFWIEYVVGKKTGERTERDKARFCDDVAKNAWNITKFNYDDYDANNFFYLIKIAANAISYMRSIGQMDSYLKTIKNPIVKNLFFELSNEVIHLETLYPFDDIGVLKGVEIIFNDHRDYFTKRKNLPMVAM